MESHSERLERDLALLRYTYEEKHGADATFDTDLLAVIGRCVTNLRHAKRSEEAYIAADEINEYERRQNALLANISGRDDWPKCELNAMEPRDASLQRSALADLRAQLAAACWSEEPSARAIGRTATAIVRAEVQLQETLKAAGVYLEKDALIKVNDEYAARIITFSRENIPQEEWYRIVDEMMAIHRKEESNER